jgi:transcriptional regulator with XRE-family HTH domain
MALAPAEVGGRIKAARLAKGWTHQQLRDAYEAHTGKTVDLRTVQRWQRGYDEKKKKGLLPRLGTLMDLADVLDVPRAFFVEQEQPEGPDALLARIVEIEESQGRNTEMLVELLRIVRADQAPPESAES